MLGRFAGVDRAALGLGNDRLHGLRFPSPTRRFCAAPAGCDLAARIRRRLLSGADDTLAALDEAVDSASLRSPKKRGPLQAVPVMARAMVEGLAEVVSRQRYPFATTVTVCRSPWYSRRSTLPGLRRLVSPRARPS